MEHQEAQQLISLYIDGELSKQEKAGFVEHIKNCPTCASELQQTIDVMDILKNVEPIVPPYDIAKAVTKELTSPQKRSRLAKQQLLRFSAIAAAFIGIIAFAVYNSGSSLDLAMQKSNSLTLNKGMAPSTQIAPQPPTMDRQTDSYSNSPELGGGSDGANYGIAESPSPQPAAKKSIQDQASVENLQVQVERKLIKTANMQLSVVKYQEFLTKATVFLKGNSGYVENTNLYKDEQTQKYSAELSVRVPEKNFQPTLDFLQKLGDLKSLNIGSQDVSMQYIDTAAKIKTYETQIAALQTMLSKAVKVSEMLQVQNELTRIQAEHDSLVSQNQYIDRSASFATITLSIREEVLSKEKIVPTENADVFTKAKAGLILSINNLISQAQQLFILVVSILPQLLIAGLIIFIVVFYYRLKFNK